MNNLADPESLLGMLQRGRGKGYLVALEAAPEMVWPLLFECVTNDPRIDRDDENREEYYAALIDATGMDLEPFRSHLMQHDAVDDPNEWSVGLLLLTLSCLAGDRRSPAALAILREYVSYGLGWCGVLRDLAAMEAPAALEQSVAVVCRRITLEADVRTDFQEAVRESWEWYCGSDERWRTQGHFLLPICEPWKTVCAHNEEFAALFRDVGITYDQPPPPREWPSKEYAPDLPLTELFAQVNKANYEAFCRAVREKVAPGDEDHLAQHLATGDRHRMILALWGLRKLRTAGAFDAVKSYIETSENADPKVRWRAFVVIQEVPTSLTLDLARQWFRRKEWYLHVPAGYILESHAAPEDMPLLLEALRTPETIRCEDHRLGSALWAMTRFPGIGWIPEVEQVFCGVPDCRRRYDAANAMHITAPVEFASQYAFECLWDCHSDTRALGCKVANLSTPAALARVRELAIDASENDDVRQAAREALSECDASASMQYPNGGHSPPYEIGLPPSPE